MIRSELVEQSRLMMKEGSKSFAAASRLFDHATRERVWLLYAWCRRCDDLTDSQELGGTLGEQNDISAKVEYLRSMTAQALSGNETGDVAFDAFGLVASECGLTLADADAVIKGFQLDAEEWRPQDDYDLMRYCWHVAGAVGVMMALVMGVNRKDSDTLDKACDLGLAFQIANISRDLMEDHAVGRCYIPQKWLNQFKIQPQEFAATTNREQLAAIVARLIKRMEEHAKSSRLGAARLPFRSRWAILSAARIYTAIGREVLSRGSNAWDNRVFTSKIQKLAHVLVAFCEALINRPSPLEIQPRWRRSDLAVGDARNLMH
jgi:phytoene synthase